MTVALGGLLGPAEIRRLAETLGLRPTKTLGQNFVHDANTVRRIVQLSSVTDRDHVLEVGPGLGSLTLALLQRAATVTAVEIDERLARRLPQTVRDRLDDDVRRLHVIEADAARLTPADLPHPPTVLVANLPYNVAVPVLLHVLATVPSLRSAVVMVQAEVADRIVAAPGSRSYGVPSVKVAWYATARRVGSVPRTVFWPVPRVDSALVALTRHDPPAGYPPGRPTAVFEVVDAAFAQRRKTLRAALARWAGGAAEAERLCRAAGVDPGARAETLAVADFTRLAAARTTVPAGPTRPSPPAREP